MKYRGQSFRRSLYFIRLSFMKPNVCAAFDLKSNCLIGMPMTWLECSAAAIRLIVPGLLVDVGHPDADSPPFSRREIRQSHLDIPMRILRPFVVKYSVFPSQPTLPFAFEVATNLHSIRTPGPRR